MFPAEPIPDTIGSYKIVRRLSVAGAAEVYLARSQGPMGFVRECELKLMSDTSDGNPAFAEELAREAAIAGRLNNPAVVRVFDFFTHQGRLVLALEHVEGTSLADLVEYLAEKRQKLGDTAIFHLGARIASALADAHAATDERGEATPIIHRNLSPETVLISVDGDVRLTGFGMGKILGRTPDTAIGHVKGTPGYMAPEQARGEPVTTKSDVYGIGVLLWSLLAARQPPTDGAWLPKISGVRTDLPREVSALIDAALDPFPGTRKISARDLEQWLSKAAPAAKGKSELREKVMSLRADAGAKDAEPPPPSSGRRITTAGGPYQGVRFGPSPALRSGPAARRPSVPAPTASPGVIHLPPPPPVPPPPVRFGAPPADVTPLPARSRDPVASDSGLRAPEEPKSAGPTLPSRALASLETFHDGAAGSPNPRAPAESFHDGAAGVPRPRGPAELFAEPTPSSTVPVSAAPASPGRTPAPEHALAPSLPLAPSPGPPPVEPSSVSIRFGAPPPSATPAPAAIHFGRPPGPLPPPRVVMPSLLTTGPGRRSLSAMGAIVVSAITATLVVSVAIYVFVVRDKGSSASVGAASAATATAAPSARIAAPAAPSSSALAGTPNPAELPYGYGYLTVVSPAVANVYMSGKLAGPVNKPLKVRCGRFFIRLATTQEGRYPDWVSSGETVLVACQDATRIEMNPRQR